MLKFCLPLWPLTSPRDGMRGQNTHPNRNGRPATRACGLDRQKPEKALIWGRTKKAQKDTPPHPKRPTGQTDLWA